MNAPISFSRSGRSGAHGKNDQRMSADVPQAMLDDLDVPVGIDWSKAEIAQVEPRKAPRVPRDTEPCPLWVFALIVAGVGGCMAMVAGWLIYGAGEGIGEMVRYADAFVVELVRWIGGVL